MNIFEKFNEMFDTNGLAKDVNEVKSNGTKVEKKDVPYGEYEVRITKLELVEHQFDDDYKGMPELTVWFKIINNAEYEGQMLFRNMKLISLKNPKANGFLINKVNEFLESIESGFQVCFEDWVQYGDLIASIFESIDGKGEYQLNFFDNKGYKDYAIIQRFV